jgi:cyanate lyase
MRAAMSVNAPVNSASRMAVHVDPLDAVADLAAHPEYPGDQLPDQLRAGRRVVQDQRGVVAAEFHTRVWVSAPPLLCARNIGRVSSPAERHHAAYARRKTMLSKKEAAQAVLAAKVRLGLTWSQLAEAVGRPVAWTTSALLGQQPMTADQAKAAGSMLDLDDDVLVALQLQPTRGALEAAVPADPTIYRFYEVLQVYGPTIKELIHEEFGDGIMSAINFRLDIRREPDPAGDRVIVVLNGKFLPYQW